MSDNPYTETDPAQLVRMLRYFADRLATAPPDLLEVVQPDLAEGAWCVGDAIEFVEDELAERVELSVRPQTLFLPAPEAAA